MKRLLLGILFAASCLAQGTLSLSNDGTPPQAGYAPGSTITLDITKAGNPNTTGLQFDVTLPASVASFTAAIGAAGTAASKTLACSTTSPVRCLVIGLANTTPIGDGVVATMSITLATAISTSPVVVTMANPVESDANGNGLAVTVGNPTVSLSIKSACDVNGDGVVSSADTSVVVNVATSKSTTAATDLNSDGKTDVLDAQIAATGATPPNFVCNAH